MDELEKLSKDLVHLSRLALSARRQDVQLYIRRLASRLRREGSSYADQLDQLLLEAPTTKQPLQALRGGALNTIPVDVDSRLQLARFENPVELGLEPIWSTGLSEALTQIVNERTHQKELLQANLLPTKSVLFTGPPGVGKTLGARWIANKLDRPLVILELAAVMSSFLGRTGNNIRNVLDYAKETDCVLFLDEFDSIAKRRDDTTEVGELKRLVTVLLQEIDDWPATGLLIAATNHPNLLDPAVWRRFDMCLEFPMPNDLEIKAAIEEFLVPDKLQQDMLTPISLVLKGQSYSDIHRDLTRLKRESLIHKEPLETKLLGLIKHKMDGIPKEARIQAILALANSGYSQRQISELTGVSRDTIRKYESVREQ